MRKIKTNKNPYTGTIIIENKDQIYEFLINNKNNFFRIDFYYGYCFGQLINIVRPLAATNGYFFEIENDDCGTRLSFNLSEIESITKESKLLSIQLMWRPS